MSEEKCKACPECGIEEYLHKNELGEGFRICASCGQEWWVNINYNRYTPPNYYEIFTQLGRSLPTKNRKGDPVSFDKRSAKRRIRKLIKKGYSVTAFLSIHGKNRTLIYSNFEPTGRIDLIFTNKKPS